MAFPNNFHLSLKGKVACPPKTTNSIQEWLLRAVNKLSDSTEEVEVICFPENISNGTASISDLHISLVFPMDSDEVKLEIRSNDIISPDVVISVLNRFDLMSYSYTLTKRVGEEVKTENGSEFQIKLIDVRSKIIR